MGATGTAMHARLAAGIATQAGLVAAGARLTVKAGLLSRRQVPGMTHQQVPAGKSLAAMVELAGPHRRKSVLARLAGACQAGSLGGCLAACKGLAGACQVLCQRQKGHLTLGVCPWRRPTLRDCPWMYRARSVGSHLGGRLRRRLASFQIPKRQCLALRKRLTTCLRMRKGLTTRRADSLGCGTSVSRCAGRGHVLPCASCLCGTSVSSCGGRGHVPPCASVDAADGRGHVLPCVSVDTVDGGGWCSRGWWCFLMYYQPVRQEGPESDTTRTALCSEVVRPAIAHSSRISPSHGGKHANKTPLDTSLPRLLSRALLDGTAAPRHNALLPPQRLSSMPPLKSFAPFVCRPCVHLFCQ